MHGGKCFVEPSFLIIFVLQYLALNRLKEMI